MKYLAILVLLFTPMLAQKKGDYISALNDAHAQECSDLTSKQIVEDAATIKQIRDDYNSLAEKYNRLVDAHEQLRSSYQKLASAPPIETVRTEYRYVETIPVTTEQRPRNCVATSTPLGQATVTGVNCY